MYLEWTDEIAAMKDALNTISYLIVDLKNVEESALNEAHTNILSVKNNSLTKEELVDRLQQSVIDYNTNKNRS